MAQAGLDRTSDVSAVQHISEAFGRFRGYEPFDDFTANYTFQREYLGDRKGGDDFHFFDRARRDLLIDLF